MELLPFFHIGACTKCFRDKRKCDRQMPCGRCKRRKIECHPRMSQRETPLHQDVIQPTTPPTGTSGYYKMDPSGLGYQWVQQQHAPSVVSSAGAQGMVLVNGREFQMLSTAQPAATVAGWSTPRMMAPQNTRPPTRIKPIQARSIETVESGPNSNEPGAKPKRKPTLFVNGVKAEQAIEHHEKFGARAGWDASHVKITQGSREALMLYVYRERIIFIVGFGTTHDPEGTCEDALTQAMAKCPDWEDVHLNLNAENGSVLFLELFKMGLEPNIHRPEGFSQQPVKLEVDKQTEFHVDKEVDKRLDQQADHPVEILETLDGAPGQKGAKLMGSACSGFDSCKKP